MCGIGGLPFMPVAEVPSPSHQEPFVRPCLETRESSAGGDRGSSTCGPEDEVAVLALALAADVERELLADVCTRGLRAALGHLLDLRGARHDASLEERLLCCFHERRRLSLYAPTATHTP